MVKSDQTLAAWPVTTPQFKLALSHSDSDRKTASYRLTWLGSNIPTSWDRTGWIPFVDVISPHGRKPPIGIVGLILLEGGLPLDWIALLLPLVQAESSAVIPRPAGLKEVKANRQFMRFACAEGSTITVSYARPGDDLPAEFQMPLHTWEPERRHEILGVMDLLDSKTALQVHDEFIVSMQDAMFGTAYWLGKRLGNTEWFLRTFTEKVQAALHKPRQVEVKEFLRLRADAGRLIERTSKEREQLDTPCSYDVFLSHYHGDASCVDAISSALVEEWPKIRIFRTQATEEQQRGFEEYPSRFLEVARSSRSIVYVATPNSLGRSFVRQELGNNALRPIFTLLVGVRRDDFENQMRRELHIAYDCDRIFGDEKASEWERFIDDLARTLQLPRRHVLPNRPDLQPGPPSPRTKQEEGDSYMAWSLRYRAHDHE